MSLKNINTIQNPNDIETISDLSNKYLYEALSNLGQRFSLKGDSVSTRCFTTLSVVNKKQSDFSDISLISKLSANKNKLYLEFFDSKNINNPLYKEELNYTIDNLFNTDTQIVLNTKINGIDYYKENALMYLDSNNNTFVIVSIGHDSEIGDVELNIDCYNIKTNMLISSIKLLDVNDDSYYIYYLESNETDDTYKISKYACNKTSIDTLYGSFEKFISEIYNIIKEYYNQYKTINSTDIFNEIISNNNFTNCIPGIDGLPVLYNVETRGFYVDVTYSSEFNYALNCMYNQLVYMYSFMFEYYCDRVYKLDNNQLNKILLYKIFERAYKDSDYKDINKFYLYIPVDYTFDYYCKDTDSFYIYSNETPVNIFYTINNINQDYIDKYYYSNILLCPHSNTEKIILYKYSVNYNEKYVDLINGINVSNLYATPYIQDGYWSINDQKTQYKAIGEDANNPNIILVCTKNISNKTSNFTNKDYSILSTVNAELLKSLTWVAKSVNVNLFDGIYTNNKQAIKYNNYDINVLIPDKLDIEKSDIGNQLKGALIINMSDINNVVTSSEIEKSQIKSILGDYSFVTTFWVFDETTYSFINIKNPNATYNALTLSNLNNINNIIKSQTDNIINSYLNNIDTSKLKYDKCIFKTGYTNTKNEFDNISVGYALLYNKSLIDTSNNIGNSDFNNPYMFELKYVEENLNTGDYADKTFTNDYGNNTINISSSNALTNYVLSTLDKYQNKYSYNYLPSDRVPLFNFGEVLTINSNILNRSNILSLDNNGQLYYAYIGTSIEEQNKSTLHIGTSNINVDLGIDSLFDVNLIDKFKTHDNLSLDFNTITLNSKNIYKPNVESKFLFTIDNTYAYTTHMTYIYDDNTYLESRSYVVIEYDDGDGYYDLVNVHYKNYEPGDPLNVKIRVPDKSSNNYEPTYYDLISGVGSLARTAPPTPTPTPSPSPTPSKPEQPEQQPSSSQPPSQPEQPTIDVWTTYMLVPITTLVKNTNIELMYGFNKQNLISELPFLDLSDNTIYADVESDEISDKYYVLVDSSKILNLVYYSEFKLNYVIDSNNKINTLEIISENSNNLPQIKNN